MALAQAGEWPAQIAPGSAIISGPLEYCWTRGLPSPDARLAAISDRLWVAVADGRIFEVNPSVNGFENGPAATMAPGGYRPAYGSDPVYVTDGGEVGRWAPETGWRVAWNSRLPGPEIDAFGLPGARVLLSSSQWPDATRLLDEHAGAISWSLPVVSTSLLAVSRVALGWRRGRLHAIELAAGRILWRREGVVGAVALSETTAWLADESGMLVEVVIATGASRAAHALPGGVPSFALDPVGRLYSVGRPLEVGVFDLRDGTLPVCRRTYEDLMLHGMPRVVGLGADGRVLVVTADSLLELRPERDDRARELWRTDRLIVDAAAQRGQLAIVTLDDRGERFLTLLAGAEGGVAPSWR